MKKFARCGLMIFILQTFFIHQGYSQSQTKKINYSKYPYWIQMMDDPNANYFEVLKAYDAFWKNRKMPLEEDDIIGQSFQKGKKGLISNWLKFREEREEEEAMKYKFDVKKFRFWQIKTEPYVREDGSIMTADERLELWRNERSK